MAWEWSHTADAYAAAARNVRRLPRAALLEVLGEWRYEDQDRAWQAAERDLDGPEEHDVRPADMTDFDTADLAGVPTDVLADQVWSRMADYATCTTGGWAAYCCPDGCHTVPFDDGQDDDTA